MSTRRVVEVLALVALCAAAAMLLMRPAQAPLPAPAEAEYSILGVRSEMPRVAVEALLGPGRVLEVKSEVETTIYGAADESYSPDSQERWVSVVWSREGHATYIRGSHLHRDGREVLGSGWKVEDAVRLLGDPVSVTQGSRFDFTMYRWSQVSAIVVDGRIAGFELWSKP